MQLIPTCAGICIDKKNNYKGMRKESEQAEDPVIKAIAMLEFEDGLRMGVLKKDCWSSNAMVASLP